MWWYVHAARRAHTCGSSVCPSSVPCSSPFHFSLFALSARMSMNDGYVCCRLPLARSPALAWRCLRCSLISIFSPLFYYWNIAARKNITLCVCCVLCVGCNLLMWAGIQRDMLRARHVRYIVVDERNRVDTWTLGVVVKCAKQKRIINFVSFVETVTNDPIVRWTELHGK